MRLLPMLGLILLAAACGEPPRSPVAPSAPLPPNSTTLPPTPAQFNITGVVYETSADGRRPLAGVGIDVSVEYQSWRPQTTSDAEGRYSISGMSPTLALKLIATKAGYSQPCRLPIIATNQVHDVYLVSNEVLSTTGVPPTLSVVQPTLSGLVFEQTPEGRRPISGAAVIGDFTGGMGWAPSATTRTDTSGRYVLCNVVDASGLGLALLVSKEGYDNAFVSVYPLVSSFDVELRRR
jgi:hypothetical protein